MTLLQIQNLLQYLGYYLLTADGVSGPGTVAAVTDFQEDNGLDPDGIPGKLTQAALLDAIWNGRFKAGQETSGEGEGTPGWWKDIRYFTREEFRCKCGGTYCNGFPAEPQEKLVRAIDNVRGHFPALEGQGGGLWRPRKNRGPGTCLCANPAGYPLLLRY